MSLFALPSNVIHKSISLPVKPNPLLEEPNKCNLASRIKYQEKLYLGFKLSNQNACLQVSVSFNNNPPHVSRETPETTPTTPRCKLSCLFKVEMTELNSPFPALRIIK